MYKKRVEEQELRNLGISEAGDAGSFKKEVGDKGGCWFYAVDDMGDILTEGYTRQQVEADIHLMFDEVEIKARGIEVIEG